MAIKERKTHLEFYKEQGIAPVRYNLSDLDAHFDRRKSLYDKLGLSKLAMKGSSILEIAAGTGHNSLYLASCEASKITLLEPNPVGIEHIKEVYRKYNGRFKSPEIISKKIEDFEPENRYEIVICENWLGNNAHEKLLLEKISSLVSVGGLLVITSISPVGFVPNLLRRHLSNILADVTLPFESRSQIIEQAFASHLATMGAMTRNVTDWVHDNMLNPAYFGICLSLPEAIDLLNSHYEIYATYPCINEDWRWFKSLHGDNRKMTNHFLDQYWLKCHNYLDSMANPCSRDINKNKKLELISKNILENVRDYEDCLLSSINPNKHEVRLMKNLEKFIDLVPDVNKNTIKGIKEAVKFIKEKEKISASNISSMKYFKHLFGRETSYASFQRLK